MNYYSLEPEVAGGLGPHSVLDPRTHPPVVSKLHYEFDGWLGDELLETFPCYIVTQRIRDMIQERGFTGAEFAPVEVTKSITFEELYPNRRLPKFVWLKVNGTPGIDDFGRGPTNKILLVVSERVLKALDLKHCDVTEFSC